MAKQDFEEQITAALEQIEHRRPAQPQREAFRNILERFVRTLSKHPVIGAAVEQVPQLPDRLTLLTWPKLRRDERSSMLNFAYYSDKLILLGQDRREFSSPDELGAYLAQDFLLRSAFPETLARYEERCTMRVEGFLRRGGPRELSREDVLVYVDPEEQRKLAEAAPGEDLSVLVREDRLPDTSPYESGGTYSCMVSGGYGMWLLFHSRAEDGRLRIAGPAMRIDELS